MEEEIRQIAARIKELREIFEVPLDVLAKECEVPVELYREYEGGERDIPVSVLMRIAHRFNIELASLITGEEPRLRLYALTRKGKGVSVERRKDYKYQSLAYNFAHKKAEPFLVTVEPEPKDSPIHMNSHPGQEFNYVLEGSIRVMLEEHEVILNEGDSLYFDSGVPHGMKALHGKTAKFLAIIF
ncbi:XRE family transcriptional regulator [Hydrogenispora ethanolica]|uniref:XRE family transcriptional regulator n=1 Tax=Hydrogenispora ethanolica TaxID=1082276 RepID=A0A4R1RGV6_HYDET|nr:cupin domain-containing protein [Hydrogenispora ethanolica]TCL65265.1 XRE family transcriptional regulator [Hydrogenispora ethanolica]